LVGRWLGQSKGDFAVAVTDREIVVTPEEWVASSEVVEAGRTFEQLARELRGMESEGERADELAKVVSPDGQITVAIPPAVYRVLRLAVHHMARGDAISLVPVHKELTTQEAADLLRVSRPFLIKQLEDGRIPYRRTGKHRRIKLQDVLEYKRQREKQVLDMLSEMAAEAQDMGLY
jgi:excisionase family DNA binding protein